jgi:hypothetical protein
MAEGERMFKRILSLLLVAVTSLAATTRTTTSAPANDLVAPTDPEKAPSPNWIWGPDKPKDGDERYFRIVFDPSITTHKTEDPFAAWLWAACDDEMTVWLNGKSVIKHSGWSEAILEDVRALLVPGENVLAVRCRNTTGPAGLAMKLEVRGQYRDKPFVLITDESWRSGPKNPKGWRDTNFNHPSFVK